jgi:hypothetical protein
MPLIGTQGGNKDLVADYYATGRNFETSPIGTLESFAMGTVARYYAPTPQSTWGTSLNSGDSYHLWNLAADLLPGRSYSIRLSHFWFNVSGITNTNATVKVFIRRTVDGSDPSFTNGSTVAETYLQPGASGWMATNPLEHRYDNFTNNTVDVRFGAFITASSCTAALRNTPAWMYVEDVGPVIVSTGTSVGAVQVTSTGTTTPPAATVKTYVKTYSANGWATYRSQNGALRGSSSSVGDTASHIYQGYSSSGSYNGDQRGLWTFPSITGDVGSGTITKVEAYIYFAHWYNNAGGTALIKVHGYGSGGWPTGSTPSFTTATSSGSWPKPGGRWVTLPSSLYAGFKNGTYKGFGIGPAGSTSSTYYGYANTNAQLRVTYSK